MITQTREEYQKEAVILLAKLDGRELKPKERMAIPPQHMSTQAPAERVRNMREVAQGYTVEQVRLEAMRCLQCKNASCVKGCPVGIDIGGFVKAAAEGDFEKSIAIIKQSSLLPAICGRVCPQENQCQETCTVGRALKDVNKAVSVGRIERFVADYERKKGGGSIPEIAIATGKKVAVVGSGPAGITVAADLRRAGHEVVIFEAFHKTGGVMVYGIPEFRLPKKIVDEEVNALRAMGVKIETNFLVGRTRQLKDFLDVDGFDAAFIGSGAGLPRFMRIEGENLVGVFSANEYLTRSNLMKAYDTDNSATPIYQSKKVAVIGGGNVAMDAARTALRLGADKVYLVYRRTEVEIPARVEEVEHAKEEGVVFHFLRNPSRILGDDTGRVTGIEVLKYTLGEPDDSGRRRPIAIDGSEYVIELDTVVVAIGNDSNPLLTASTPEIETNKWGNIVTDSDGKTSMDKVYAGGDIVLGAATVILAMGEGRKAATAMNAMLAGGG
jgi:glutamate synthase (NADPH) small chain